MYEELEEKLTAWRHALHQIPEPAFEEIKTSEFIAEKLREMGYDVHQHIGKTGIVANLTVGTSSKAIGLRADMDCIKVAEMTKLSYTSQHEGCMHACGHDGHVVTLLGAAYLLAKNKNFNGTVRLIFQPAEEPGYGAMAMLNDGLLDRFPMDAIYGLHNIPGLPQGTIHARVGALWPAKTTLPLKFTARVGMHRHRI